MYVTDDLSRSRERAFRDKSHSNYKMLFLKVNLKIQPRFIPHISMDLLLLSSADDRSNYVQD